MSRILHPGSPTFGESTRRSGGRPGGSGQVRGRALGRFAEVGGAQGGSSSTDCLTSGSITHCASRPRERGEFAAGRSSGVDPGAGQPPRTSSAACSRRSTPDVGCGASPAQRAIGGHTNRRSRFRSLPDPVPICTTLTKDCPNAQRSTLCGLNGVRVGETSHPGPQDSDDLVVMAPGRSMVVSTRVDSDDELASQLNQSSDAVAVQVDPGARHHGRVAVFASDDDFSQPSLERLRLVSRRTPLVFYGQSEVHA